MVAERDCEVGKSASLVEDGVGDRRESRELWATAAEGREGENLRNWVWE